MDLCEFVVQQVVWEFQPRYSSRCATWRPVVGRCGGCKVINMFNAHVAVRAGGLLVVRMLSACTYVRVASPCMQCVSMIAVGQLCSLPFDLLRPFRATVVFHACC